MPHKKSLRAWMLVPIPGEGGNAILIALVVVAVIGFGAVAVNRNLETSAKAAMIAQKHEESLAANISGLAVLSKLLGPNGATLPEFYVDPYISTAHKVVQVTSGSSPAWSFAGNTFTVYTPNTTTYSAADLSALYTKGQPKAINPATDQTTKISIVSIDPPADPVNLPYLIPSLVVQSSTVFSSGQMQKADRNTTTTARVALPPPAPPSCTLSSDAAGPDVPNGTKVTFTVKGSGVIQSAYVSDGGANTVTFPTPTAANSVLSNGVTLGTMQATLTTPQSVATVTVTGYVKGPQGTQTTCSTSVQINPTPPGCGPAGLTQVQLLTPAMQNNTPGNFIEYSAYNTDCHGVLIPLPVAPVGFDYAASEPAYKTLTYTASAMGVSVSGSMNTIYGSDLFGHTTTSGGQYVHRATAATNFGNAAQVIDLTIFMQDQTEVPYATATYNGASGAMQTAIQIGSAAVAYPIVGLN